MESKKLLKQLLITLTLHVVLGLNLLGQSTTQMMDLPNVIPPSPNAASLGKFGDIPVGAYTGIPSIGIPLYNIQVGKFSLPISLDYHSGGLKVEEVSGSVGLGWALSAGGVITRSMHGQPDESGHGYLNSYNLTDSAIAADGSVTQSFCAGILDEQPDIFYYNFAGQSGKFILDTTTQHNARFMPYSNVKLTHDAALDSFQIIDANGIIYQFSTPETTSVEGGGEPPTYISAWYLTTIITPYGSIHFTYATEQTSQLQISQLDYLAEGPGGTHDRPSARGSSSTVVVDARRLTQIISPFETVTFASTPGRMDMPSASSINGLSVTDPNGHTIKQFTFTQSYFGNPPTLDPTKVRLKLDQVDEISVSNATQKKSYRLQYYSPTSVPSLQSYAKDWWGFYNGQTGNTTCLPYVDPAIWTDYVANQATSYGIRDPSAASSQVGVLQSIQYPTGGSSQFIYEGNDYGSAGDGLTITKTVTNTCNTGVQHPSAGNLFSHTSTFSITTTQNTTLLAYGTRGGGTEHDGNGPTAILNLVSSEGVRTNIKTLIVTNASQTVYPYLTPGNYELITQIDDDGTNQQCTANLTYTSTDTSSQAHVLPTGGIRIKQIINIDSVGGNQNIKTFKYRFPDDSTKSSGSLLAEVQTVRQKLAFNGTAYLVRGSSPSNYLGATQGSHVGYAVVTEMDGVGDNINGRKESYFSSPWNIHNQSSAESSVLEQNQIQAGGSNALYQTDNDVYRGMLQKELLYNAGGTLLHSTVNNYNISYPNFFSPGSFPANYYEALVTVGYLDYLCFFPCSQCYPSSTGGSPPPCTSYMLNNYTLVHYKIVCPWIYKTNTITIAYDQNGLNPVTDTVNYYYDNPTHALVTRQTTFNSKGDSIKTVNKYASDQAQISGLSTNAANALTTMVAINKIAPPIEVSHYNNNSLLDLTRTDYLVWDATRQIVEPQHVWRQILSHSLEDRLDFYQYDTLSNILEVSKAGDEHLSYLWDYRNEYPVAAVKNATRADIAYTSFEADGSGSWTLGSASRDTTNGFTGTQSYLLNSDISRSGLTSSTTYIVSYWTRNNSPFTITGTISGYPVKGKTITYNNISWTLYTHRVTGQTTISISGSGPIDELRLYPLGAQMTTYTYTPLVGMSSQTDMGNRVTYYEYDGLQRLMRIRDQDHNILKSLEYQYQVSSGCGPNCYSITMQTLAGTNTLGYPVGVFDVHGNLLGNATGPVQYVSLWNADTANARIGTLSTGSDSLHFSMTLNSGMTLPTGVTGCRYYQVDLTWNNIDGVRNTNGAYIDFGDGTGMRMPANSGDTATIIAPNTTYTSGFSFELNSPAVYYTHTYSNSNQKTLTFYHNDAAEHEHLDNVNVPATSLTQLKNLRGNLPQNTVILGGSCYQDSSMTSMINIPNWNNIHTVQLFRFATGDHINSSENISYAQDFMKNNKGLLNILTCSGYYFNNIRDTSFRLSRLKSDWNTYFTSLQHLQISDEHWNREDLTALTQLNYFQIWATTQNHQNGSGNALSPIPSSAIDNIINQIANGAGQTVSNGAIDVESGGPSRTPASDTALGFLIAKGWVIAVNGVLQHN